MTVIDVDTRRENTGLRRADHPLAPWPVRVPTADADADADAGGECGERLPVEDVGRVGRQSARAFYLYTLDGDRPATCRPATRTGT